MIGLLAMAALAVDTAGGTTVSRLPTKRLTPPEIVGIAPMGGGVGTSGLSGIRTRLLVGNPSAAGPYSIELIVPPYTRIASHSHRDDRVASVTSGTWYFGYGEKAEDAKFKALPAGSFYTEPGGVAHFARTGKAAVRLLIHGHGPSDTIYSVAEPRPLREK